MSRIVLVGIFLLVLASVVDGSSSSSRRSSRIRGSPRKPMSGLFRGLCPLFRESAIRTEDESVINGRESVVLETSLESTTVLPVTEPSTVPTTTEPIIDTGSNGTETAAKRCFYGMKNNTEVLPEVINPEVFNVTLAECTDICDKNVSCIDVESYGKTPVRCTLNMGIIRLTGESADSCASSCMANPACLQASSHGITCKHYNRAFFTTDLQRRNDSYMYLKICLPLTA